MSNHNLVRRPDVTGETQHADPQIDWRARADGQEHVLVKGEHFTREAPMVRRAAGMWAARNGLRAVTRIEWGLPDVGDDKVFVTFVPKTGKV